MTLDPETLRQLVERTLAHYHARADAFWEGTRHHDVEQLRNLAVATYLNAQHRWPDNQGAVSANLAQARIDEASARKR